MWLAACGSSLANPRQLPIYVSRPARSQDGVWLELHIHRDGRHWYGDRVVYDPSSEDFAVLSRALQELRTVAIARGHVTAHPDPATADQHIFAPVLIRSAKRTEWRHIQSLMDLCATTRIGCQTVRLALLED